ncbi:DAO-domain-containing protein [Coniochaeta ligniaria NRRL 30616]|uniref:Glycerol-3-phosphate dehydrogenase n=1 Tax=Coniochaeta ligniaria NRRL 30616 TaxID=1408157 RepID=A0A1J7J888_9PEZI|nr:DAO-domain-containing protein [Coniochaeta ligniaria NRRL 30616]
MSARQGTRRIGRYVAAATVTVSAGSAFYLIQSRRSNARLAHQPLAPLERDGSGRIIPPTFPQTKSRLDHLAELKKHSSAADPYDLLIIGGGATGTGIALDAATRGLRVALVERDDFSSGTSSKSTKLVHGGVRYLEKAFWNLDYSQYELVREALRERSTFLDVAPHLAKPLPILLPVYNWWQLPYFWAGTKAYDLLAWSQGMGLTSSYLLGKNAALDAFPLLKKDKLTGALVYYDGQQNDARVNVSLAMTASLYGATMLNHAEVTKLEKDASGRICGARIRDRVSGDDSEHVVYAKGVINATGPYADAVEKLDDPSRMDLVAPSSGVHIVLPKEFCPDEIGILQASSDGRVIFFLPWEGRTIAGTTDNPCAIEHEPVAKDEEINFILKEIRKFLSPEKKLDRDDVLAAWSGIRPLVRDPKAKNTESLVRNHLVTVSPAGLLTCAGGKWTTYRQMAEDAVDEAVRVFNLTPRTSAPPTTASPDLDATKPGACQTHHVRLIGAHGYSPLLPSQLAATFNLDADIAQHLADCYGDRAWEVASLSSSKETSRLVPSLPFIDAEIRYGARRELAQTAADVLARRMRLAFLDAQAALETLPRVVDVMSEELGWDQARKDAEWKETVHFLSSMGLNRDLLSMTREDVVEGRHRERRNSFNGKKAAVTAPTGEGRLALPAPSLAKSIALDGANTDH